MKHLSALCLLVLVIVLSASAVQAGSITPSAPRTSVASAPGAAGTIAYIVGKDEGDEIWLSEPDGTQKRRIYSAGIADLQAYISGLAWRPDSGELVFSSNYERTCSVYAADLYAIRADGSGYRRITNGPDCAALASYPQGRVTLSIAADGYMAYILGAPGLKTVSGGGTTFNVADLGDFGQPIVFIAGNYRWMSDVVDVKAGQNVSASVDLYGSGLKELGAYRPVWRRDSSRIAYSYGDCAALIGIADQPTVGTSGEMLLSTLDGVTPCGMAWGPTADKADQIVYWMNIPGDAKGVYLTTENSHSAGTKLFNMDVYIFDLEYLPDGSGLTFSAADNPDSSNIYRYDFGSGNVTQLTDYTDRYVREFAQSPDGQKIIFELAANVAGYPWGAGSDLYMMGMGESTPHLFAAGGADPSWSLSAPQVPPVTPPSPPSTPPGKFKLYLPLLVR